MGATHPSASGQSTSDWSPVWSLACVDQRVGIVAVGNHGGVDSVDAGSAGFGGAVAHQGRPRRCVEDDSWPPGSVAVDPDRLVGFQVVWVDPVRGVWFGRGCRWGHGPTPFSRRRSRSLVPRRRMGTGAPDGRDGYGRIHVRAGCQSRRWRPNRGHRQPHRTPFSLSKRARSSPPTLVWIASGSAG